MGSYMHGSAGLAITVSIEPFLETPFLTRKKAETLRESNVCLGTYV
ncbi:hypothetical protein NC651_037757 [Populus alba x Populus x berolinensis]|nr:hypothetical protein NC651_037757 [Populus alba x Populus x berolinensis]